MDYDLNIAETKKYRILLVDDDRGWSARPIAKLTERGFDVKYEEKAENTLSKIKSFKPDAVLLDVLFRNENKGKPTFGKIKEQYPTLPVIMLTSTLKDSFNSNDYPGCAFPYAKDQLNPGDIKKEKEVYDIFADKIKRAIDHPPTPAQSLNKTFDFVVGSTVAMEEVCKTILRAAPSSSSVLILGESGTGKELIAKAIHYKSPREGKPFIKVNCAVFNEGVLESELFGHIKGAFTGAIADKQGVFERANGGTLFLDEIGDITPHTQAKLLRVLQEREFERVGDAKTIKVDVRIIAATNKDLTSAVKKEDYREDLYYRLNVISISIPPLRDRKEDISDLLAFFINKFNNGGKSILIETETGKRDYLRADVLTLLKDYDWPGNIREFEHAIERAMLKAGDSNVLLPEHFEIHGNRSNTSGSFLTPEKAAKKIFKKELTYDEVLKTYRRDSQEMRKIVDLLINEMGNNNCEISQESIAEYLTTDVNTVKALLGGKKDKSGKVVKEKISLVEKKKAVKRLKKNQ